MRRRLFSGILFVAIFSFFPGFAYASELQSKLMGYANMALGLGRGLGILGAVAGAAGLIFSPNEEGKRKFKTVLVGCMVLALASIIVNTIWETGQ